MLLGQIWKTIRTIKKLFLSLILIGIVVAAVGWSKPAYTDEAAYHAAYMKIDPYLNDQDARDIADKEFMALRRQYLTARHTLIDFGFTISLLGLIGFLVARKGPKNIKGPGKKWQYFALVAGGAAAVAISEQMLQMAGEVRGDYPHWADAMVIGTMMNVAFGAFYLLLLGIHLLFLRKNFHYSQPIVPMKASNSYWLALMAFGFAVMFFYDASQGLFPRLASLAIIVYYFLSLLSGRRTLKTTR